MGGIDRRELMKATALGGVALSIGGDHVPPKPHHSEKRTGQEQDAGFK
jgi:hypothetical protein